MKRITIKKGGQLFFILKRRAAIKTFFLHRLQSVILLLFLACLAEQPIQAQAKQDGVSVQKKWQFRAEPYLMFPNMSGNTGVNALPLIEVDASASDIFKRLQIGGMIFLEVSNGTWSVNSDLLFMSLSQDASPSALINSGQANAKQLGWELAVFRKVTPWLEFGLGGLLNQIEMDLDLTLNQPGGGTGNRMGNKRKTWYDPMLITRLSTDPKKKFYGQFRGEIGGFGIGSDFAWQAQAIAGYRFSKLFDMSAGYRAISLDYVNGEGADTFVYDMVTFGPMIRVGFSF